MKTTISDIGQQFVEFLAEQHISLDENNDGRLESLNSEDNLTDVLRLEFSDRVNILDKGHNRSFGDLDIEIDGKVYPINIKMVDPDKSGTFNAGSVKVFNYVFYGGKDTNWSRLAKKIRDEKPTKLDSEYYYLIFYKRSDRKPVFVSLTDLDESSIVTNPSNPLQLKKNIKTKKRNETEKVDFMLGLLKDILRKKAAPYLLIENIV